MDLSLQNGVSSPTEMSQYCGDHQNDADDREVKRC